MNRFFTQQWPRMLFGAGTALELGAQCAAMGVKRVMAVYGGHLARSGEADCILKTLEAEGIAVVHFQNAEPESPDYVVERLGKAIADCGADCVAAIGGGSAIDTARAAALYSQCADIPFSACQEKGFVPLTEEQLQAVKLVCVPTTAGTGAEMSAGGPLLNTKTNVKGGPFFGPKTAELVILDPELTVGLPPMLTYTTAMDALAHAIEGMTGKLRSPRSDLFCGQAVEYIWRSLPKVLADGKDLEARGELLLAASYAIGVETLRHLGHAVGQPVGGMFHIAHGQTCALALPPTVRAIAHAPEVERELRLIAEKMKLDAASPTVGEAIAAAIENRNREMGVQSLKELGLSFDEVKKTLPQIMADGRLLPNAPVEATTEVVEGILRGMYEY